MSKTPLDYFPTKEDASIQSDHFGTIVPDPYRWLEDDRAAETIEWVNQQNDLTQKHLAQIPARDKIQTLLLEAWNYPRTSSPFVEGDYIYWFFNTGTQNQSVLFRKPKDDENDDRKEVFLDPNTFSEKGTSSLSSISFTDDGSICCYYVSHAGSDVNVGRFIYAKDMKPVEEKELEGIKFSGNALYKNTGLFYSKYAMDASKSVLTAMTDSHRLYYHKIGTSQEEDKPVFGHLENQKRRYIHGTLSEDADNKIIAISAAQATSGNELYFKHLNDDNLDTETGMVLLVDDQEHDWNVVDIYNNCIYIDTNWEAPNSQVLRVDLQKFLQLSKQGTPDVITNFTKIPECFTVIIPHDPERIYSCSRAGKYLVVNYRKDFLLSAPQVFDMDGKLVRTMTLAIEGSASGWSQKRHERYAYYSVSSYINPATIFKYDLETDESTLFFAPEIKIAGYNPSTCVSKITSYTSKDGTSVPITISYDPAKVDLESGKNPLMLYGYGGFNISLFPSFSIPTAVWISLGGIYAVPNIRGGGEKGDAWHKAGTKFKKQNVFDDFIAAAEFLIAEKYTTKDYLCCCGGSNGGLLVGACATQRPDLFKAAVPMVGVLDMLRYHKSTAGAGWAEDYLTADQSKQAFEYLFKYSPVHNVKDDVEYPATMVTCADHDDRVVPANSYKFIANLQKKSLNANKPEEYANKPVIIRIDIDAGHGAGKSLAQMAQERADIQAFCLAAMGKDDI